MGKNVDVPGNRKEVVRRKRTRRAVKKVRSQKGEKIEFFRSGGKGKLGERERGVNKRSWNRIRGETSDQI